MTPFIRILLAALSLVAAAALSADAAAQRPPNIIFVLADDLGYGDLGCFGQDRIRTPNLDRLAAEGTRFTNAYAGSPVCAPSRCVLLTGMNIGRASVRGNRGPDRPPAAQALTRSDVTIATVLKRAGYATGVIGKWGLGEPGAAADGLPSRHGFDHSFGYLNQTHAHNSWPTHLWRNETRVDLRNVVPDERPNGAGIATERHDFAPDLIENEALEFIRANRERPFFLYYSPTQPHANNESRPIGLESNGHGQYADRDWPDPMKSYAELVTGLDRSVGRLVDLLRELGIENDTLVVFSSDNGPHKESGGDPEYFNSSGGLRGIKRHLYEGGIRVPTIAWWPGKVPAGRTSDAIWYFADVLPTFAAAAGTDAPAGIDGANVLPTFVGGDQPGLAERPIFWEFYELGYRAAVRRGKWKAVVPKFGEPVELYDLSDDPGETRDLAGSFPELAGEFLRIMRESRVDSEYWKLPVN